MRVLVDHLIVVTSTPLSCLIELFSQAFLASVPYQRGIKYSCGVMVTT